MEFGLFEKKLANSVMLFNIFSLAKMFILSTYYFVLLYSVGNQ